MKRGEVRWVRLEPAEGAEARKRQPAVIVSNDGANDAASHIGRGVVTVVPLTSNTERVFPFQVLVPSDVSGLPRDSKAQAEQVRSLSVTRIGGGVGTLTDDVMAKLDDALRTHLRL
ncbi:MAG: type II toxin-antitoxin system PemK/MazF family toxin [Actinomycetes bacterium]